MHQRTPREFLEQQKISKHLYCSICHEVFDNPSRIICGHTFCYQCILGWRMMSKTCPVCKTKFLKWRPDKDLVAAHIIDDLMTKCSFGKCEWTGLYSTLKKHQRFCQYREKRHFQNTNEEQVVRLLDDEEVKQQGNEIKIGRKKVKKNEDNTNLPNFPQSSSSNQSLNLEPLQPNRRSSHIHQASQNIINSSHQNVSHTQSSSSDGYLQTNLHKIIKKKRSTLRHNHFEVIECEQSNINQEEKKKQNHIQKQLSEISFDQEEDISLYPKEQDARESLRNGFRKKNNSGFREEEEDDQQEFFRYVDKRSYQPENLYVYEQYIQEEERLKRQRTKNLNTSRWNIVHQNSATSKAEDSDSSEMSNPFEEPIHQIPKRHPKVNEVIILDSSDQSQVEMSKQSGEMSSQLHTHRFQEQILKYNSIFTQNPQSNEDLAKQAHVDDKEKKEQILAQIQELTESKPEKQFNQRHEKREKLKQESLDY